MKKLFKRRSKKVGAPPGSLIYTGDSIEKTTYISLFIYDAESIVEKHPKTIHETILHLKEGKKAWIHISGIHDPHLINALGQHFKLHPLLLEDIMSPSQRSKLDDYKNYLYIATHILNLIGDNFEEEQLSLIIGENVLISFSEKKTDIFKPIEERLCKPTSRMRKRGSDYIAYTILDCIVDNYFLILEKVDVRLESLEATLLSGTNSSTMFLIQNSKKELGLLRKTIWPMREVINSLRRIDTMLIQETTRIYLYDVYDHTIQAIEAVEIFRELSGGLHDIYLANVNQKMNESIQVLTIVSTIFVPLTFLASLYGMNFDVLPGSHHPNGFLILFLVMIFVTVIMIVSFRRKNWI